MARPAYLRAPAEPCRITGLSRWRRGLHNGADLLHVVDVEGGHAVTLFGGVVEIADAWRSGASGFNSISSEMFPICPVAREDSLPPQHELPRETKMRRAAPCRWPDLPKRSRPMVAPLAARHSAPAAR